ncbi:hypothetical protein APS67_006678 [Streptomyces sp. AVP053U2]|nr:hypothetical protein APS67_006678 [Streptomyces sp. AVP053U2]
MAARAARRRVRPGERRRPADVVLARGTRGDPRGTPAALRPRPARGRRLPGHHRAPERPRGGARAADGGHPRVRRHHVHGGAGRPGGAPVPPRCRYRHPDRSHRRGPHRRRPRRPGRLLRQHPGHAHRPVRRPDVRRCPRPGPGNGLERLRPPGRALRPARRGAGPDALPGPAPAVPGDAHHAEHRGGRPGPAGCTGRRGRGRCPRPVAGRRARRQVRPGRERRRVLRHRGPPRGAARRNRCRGRPVRPAVRRASRGAARPGPGDGRRRAAHPAERDRRPRRRRAPPSPVGLERHGGRAAVGHGHRALRGSGRAHAAGPRRGVRGRGAHLRPAGRAGQPPGPPPDRPGCRRRVDGRRLPGARTRCRTGPAGRPEGWWGVPAGRPRVPRGADRLHAGRRGTRCCPRLHGHRRRGGGGPRGPRPRRAGDRRGARRPARARAAAGRARGPAGARAPGLRDLHVRFHGPPQGRRRRAPLGGESADLGGRRVRRGRFRPHAGLHLVQLRRVGVRAVRAPRVRRFRRGRAGPARPRRPGPRPLGGQPRQRCSVGLRTDPHRLGPRRPPPYGRPRGRGPHRGHRGRDPPRPAGRTGREHLRPDRGDRLHHRLVHRRGRRGGRAHRPTHLQRPRLRPGRALRPGRPRGGR